MLRFFLIQKLFIIFFIRILLCPVASPRTAGSLIVSDRSSQNEHDEKYHGTREFSKQQHMNHSSKCGVRMELFPSSAFMAGSCAGKKTDGHTLYR